MHDTATPPPTPFHAYTVCFLSLRTVIMQRDAIAEQKWQPTISIIVRASVHPVPAIRLLPLPQSSREARAPDTRHLGALPHDGGVTTPEGRRDRSPHHIPHRLDADSDSNCRERAGVRSEPRYHTAKKQKKKEIESPTKGTSLHTHVDGPTTPAPFYQPLAKKNTQSIAKEYRNREKRMKRQSHSGTPVI